MVRGGRPITTVDASVGDPSEDQEMGQAIFRQVVDLWINPEIARRRQAGLLPDGFPLQAAQVLVTPGGDSPLIRFNEEVKGVAKVSVRRAVDAGEAVMASDFEKFHDFELLETDFDCGHVTLLRDGDTWFIKFNFLYNRSKSRDYHTAALEFWDVAAEACRNGKVRAVVENLLHAGECSAKARLLETPGNPFFVGAELKRNSHTHVHGLIARYERAVPDEDRTSALLKRLRELRNPATYLAGPFELSQQEAAELVETSQRLIGDRSAYFLAQLEE